MCSPDALTSAASVCKPLRPSNVAFSRIHDKACAIGRSGLHTRRPQVPQPYQLLSFAMGSRDLASRRPQTRFPHIRICTKEPNVRGSAGPDGIVTISPSGSVASLHHRSSRPLSPTSGRDDNPWRSSIGSPRPRRRCRHAVRLCQCGGRASPTVRRRTDTVT